MTDRPLPPPEAVAHVLLTGEQIRARVRELARHIDNDYAGQELVLLGVLTGAVVLLADLMREIGLPVRVKLASAASYGNGTTAQSEVKLSVDLGDEVAGAHVLVVEDIVDTGRTLSTLVEAIARQGPASVRTCCLLDKPSRREVAFEPDYTGFQVPDEFVVGYGLDYAGMFRNLPYIAVLKPEVYRPTPSDGPGQGPNGSLEGAGTNTPREPSPGA
jgi:hypoxanthine phosphoribosyltransferase